MNREEFLRGLENALSGNVPPSVVRDNLRYYDDYIRSERQKGRSESDIMDELGDPRLIAKTLIDTDNGSAQEDYGEYSSYGSSYGSKMDPPPQPEKKWKKVLDLSTWHGKAIVIVAAAVAIILLVLLIGAVLPFFIILAIILYFLSWLKKRNNQ